MNCATCKRHVLADDHSSRMLNEELILSWGISGYQRTTVLRFSLPFYLSYLCDKVWIHIEGIKSFIKLLLVLINDVDFAVRSS